MLLRLPKSFRVAIVGLIALTAKATAASDNQIIAQIRAMELRDSLRLLTPRDRLVRLKFFPAVSPDGLGMCWSINDAEPWRPGKPFLNVKTPTSGIRPIWLEGEFSNGMCAISSNAELLVGVSFTRRLGVRRLLALDLRSGVSVEDLTPFVTGIEITDLELISTSGGGTLVALGSREQIQVLQIPSGRTVYTGSGRVGFPGYRRTEICLPLLNNKDCTFGR